MMTNTMVKVKNDHGTAYVAVPTHNLAKLLEIFSENCTAETYDVGKMPLEALPEEIQADVRRTLRAFDNVSVVYENAEFRTSCAVSIKAHYSSDHFVCGYYKAEEVYTKEERRQNFLEEFGYVPCYLK